MEQIKNNSEYYTCLARIESLIEKGFDHLSEKETSELAQLSEKVEIYEIRKYPMPLKPSVVDILENIMREKRLNQSELSKILDVPDSTLSGILNGKRKLNLDLAKKLHSKFHVDGNMILESI
jgi:HTH-type transcriptional regulator/antitoxin HigA